MTAPLAPRMLHIWRCDVCQATTERDAASPADAPMCGRTTSETNRFPDGGWVRIEQHESHGVMTLANAVRGNPLQSLVDHAEELRLRQMERDVAT